MKTSVAATLGAFILACAASTPTARAATEAERLAAIQTGLAYLHDTQTAGGSWSLSGDDHAITGAAAFAFLSQQDKWGRNAALYQAAVDKALAHLVSTARTIDVSTRSDGLNICQGGSGSCKGVYWLGNADPIYTAGLIAPAIASYGVTVGTNVVATASGPLAGMTWSQIAQGIANTIAAAQTTTASGKGDGGWRGLIGGKEGSAISTTQWAVLAFLYAETLGAITPQAVKNELKVWVDSSQNTSGAACYAAGTEPCDHADTGGWLLAAKFLGYDLPDSRLHAALAFLNTHWQSTANNVWYGNFGHPYAMWSVYKALETSIGLNDTTHITNLLTDCGAGKPELSGKPPGSVPCTWSEDYNHWLVNNQNFDGSWSGYSYWADPLAVAFYVNILGGIHVPVATHICPLSQTFWKSTPGAWPVASLSLGGQTYTKQELLVILSAPILPGMSADASMVLARELITVKLTVNRGSDAAPIASTIAEADRLLSGFTGKLPYHVAPSSLHGQQMTDAATELGNYSNGFLTRSCTPADALTEGSTLERTEASPQTEEWTIPAAANAISSVVPSIATVQASQLKGTSKRPRPYLRKGVTALAVSADGSVLASASTDNEIRTWSAGTGEQRRNLRGSGNLLTGLAFSPDSGTLNSVGRDSLVRVWDAESGSELARFAAHEHAIRAIAVSPDGRFIASVGEESRIMLWDQANRKLSRILFGPTDFVNALSFSPDGRLLAVGGEDGRVLCFDFAVGTPLYTLLGHSGPIDAVGFSPDGTVLASGGQDTVIRLWNTVNGRQRQTLTGHSAPIRTIAFSPDGRLIASGGEDTRIMLWNVASGVPEKILSGSKGPINVLAFSRNGLLTSADEDGFITVWNVTTGARTLIIKVPPAN